MARTSSPRSSRSLSLFYIVLAAIALGGIGVLYLAMRGSGLPSFGGGMAPAELARLGDRAVGPADAPLTVVEFADFQCGGCAIYAQRELPRIKNELAQEGLVRFVFMDFPLPMHEHAVLAARAGRCAHDQGRFWEYHDRVYAGHAEWAFQSDPSGTLVEYAAAEGLNPEAFQQCLRSDQFTEEVNASYQLGRSVGVRATPSLVVNGRLLDGVPSAEQLREMALQAREGS
jgi:protein-disulfide isomerase